MNERVVEMRETRHPRLQTMSRIHWIAGYIERPPNVLGSYEQKVKRHRGVDVYVYTSACSKRAKQTGYDAAAVERNMGGSRIVCIAVTFIRN